MMFLTGNGGLVSGGISLAISATYSRGLWKWLEREKGVVLKNRIIKPR